MKKIGYILIAIMALVSASCGSVKKITMLTDMEPGKAYDAQEVPAATIRKGDKLSIYVTCKNAALASPFNLLIGSAAVDESTGNVATVPDDAKGYVVDNNGMINFPVLDMLKVEGMTLDVLKQDIQNRIINSGYIKDPLVIAEFINFQITTVGELGNAVHTITNGSVNIFEAVAMSGGLTDNAKLSDVWVIRTDGNTRNIYALDLQSKSCFDSPAFYLQQGDIVYAKPEKRVREGKGWQIGSLAISSLSSVSMAFYWLSQIFGFTL